MASLPDPEDKTQVRLYRREQTGPAPSTDGPADVRIGRMFGDFRLVRYIDRGGMGQVWEAHQESLNRKVALKLVLPDRLDAKSFELFAREARAGGRMHHPNVVETYSHGNEGELAWIAQELVEGSWTLKDFLDDLRSKDELPPGYFRSVAELIAKIADALSAAHQVGVIHRDVKPQNVLITRDDEPKLTDFGLARIIDETALSQTGELAGTYFYMSPEQVAAKRVGIDYRTDIFSLGVVLYETLTLQRAFVGDTSQQICAQIVFTDPPDARQVRSQCPRDLAVICTKALEKSPNERYATMADLAADLRRQMRSEPIHASPPSTLDRMRKWIQRNPARASATGIAAIAFVVISFLSLRLATSNAALQDSNQSLAHETLAAKQAREEAQRETANVLRLSLSQDYVDLVLLADELWPAHPEKIDQLTDWVAKARELTGELTELLRDREELRALAIPRTDQERRAERESHPDFQKLLPLRSEIVVKERALSVRRGKAEVKLPTVDWSEYPGDARSLNTWAWPMVNPARKKHGQEPLGLVLARRAEKLAPDDLHPDLLDTLAWACFAVGDSSGALAASREALAIAPPARMREYAQNLAGVQAAVKVSLSTEGLASAEMELANLHASYFKLDERIGERRTWRFPEDIEETTKVRWWHNQATNLLVDLETLQAVGSGLLTENGLSEEHGWSVPHRLAFANRLRQNFAPGGGFATRWEASLSAINEAYTGLNMTRQMGLVPIGMDPTSKLWEFWHVQSGTEPRRSESGKLILEEASGLVFVLLPGSSFWMGAQPRDPGLPNYDKNAVGNEIPVHEVQLSPFFLSKYELTQAQWERITGADPSFRTARKRSYVKNRLHPVEQVNWFSCDRHLRYMGLCIPSEAQWEYGCRASTSTPRPFGEDLFPAHANIRDEAHDLRFKDSLNSSAWNDGFSAHAPVGSLKPNSFGLHDMIGNVWEWCRDGYEISFYGSSPRKDPVNVPSASGPRISRGGGFDFTAIHARSSKRHTSASPSIAVRNLGVRPARAIVN